MQAIVCASQPSGSVRVLKCLAVEHAVYGFVSCIGLFCFDAGVPNTAVFSMFCSVDTPLREPRIEQQNCCAMCACALSAVPDSGKPRQLWTPREKSRARRVAR